MTHRQKIGSPACHPGASSSTITPWMNPPPLSFLQPLLSPSLKQCQQSVVTKKGYIVQLDVRGDSQYRICIGGSGGRRSPGCFRHFPLLSRSLFFGAKNGAAEGEDARRPTRGAAAALAT